MPTQAIVDRMRDAVQRAHDNMSFLRTGSATEAAAAAEALAQMIVIMPELTQKQANELLRFPIREYLRLLDKADKVVKISTTGDFRYYTTNCFGKGRARLLGGNPRCR